MCPVSSRLPGAFFSRLSARDLNTLGTGGPDRGIHVLTHGIRGFHIGDAVTKN